MNTGERIKERRKYLELSVDDIANKLNKNRATVYRYESNDIENLPINILEPLAQILETTPAYLMGLEDIKEVLSNEEKYLLSNFKKLNDIGKREANKRVLELTELSKYVPTKEEYNFAAHDDTLNAQEAKTRIEKVKDIFKQMDEE